MESSLNNMKMLTERLLDAFLAAHWGVISRAEATGIGVTPAQIDWAVRTGRWEVVHRGVYRRSGSPLGPEGAALAACRAVGPHAVVSHRSAALFWGLVDGPVAQPSVTVPHDQHPRLGGIEVHRSVDLDRHRCVIRRNLPVTDPVRTLVDLGQVVTSTAELDGAVDRARVARLVTIVGLEAELERLARRGRQGPSALRRALRRRGFLEAPTPSILESRVARLLAAWRIPVISVETTVVGGRYRLDFLLTPDVALEVDGYAFHSSPEAKASDAGRRADLAAAGIVVIEADWVTVTRRPAELRRRIVRVLAAAKEERRPPGRRRLSDPRSSRRSA